MSRISNFWKKNAVCKMAFGKKKGLQMGIPKLNIVEVSHELHFATFDLIYYSNVKYLIGLLTEN